VGYHSGASKMHFSLHHCASHKYCHVRWIDSKVNIKIMLLNFCFRLHTWKYFPNKDLKKQSFQCSKVCAGILMLVLFFFVLVIHSSVLLPISFLCICLTFPYSHGQSVCLYVIHLFISLDTIHPSMNSTVKVHNSLLQFWVALAGYRKVKINEMYLEYNEKRSYIVYLNCEERYEYKSWLIIAVACTT